jgi:hypothetical protein
MSQPPSPFRNFFHAGYVVLDLQKVMADMRETFGVREWKILPLPEGSPAKAIGFAYVGATMIELVELDLRYELLPMHRGWLPPTEGEAKLNHLAYILDSDEELQAVIDRFEAQGIKTAWLDAFGDIFTRYYYADTTAQLGHFCEFVSPGPAMREFLASVPRN